MNDPRSRLNESIPNPFDTRNRVNEYTAREIAILQSKLDKQLGPEYISARQGPGGVFIHYLAAEKVIKIANEVFGFNGWSSSIQQVQVDFVSENPTTGRVSTGVSVIVRVTLKDGVYHEDLGYGQIENCKGKAAAFEKAKKEAVTDALKRALRNFGNVLGNCLYDKDYLKRVTKIKAKQHTQWSEDNLYRHPDFVPVKPEPAIPSPVPPSISNPGEDRNVSSRTSTSDPSDHLIAGPDEYQIMMEEGSALDDFDEYQDGIMEDLQPNSGNNITHGNKTNPNSDLAAAGHPQSGQLSANPFPDGPSRTAPSGVGPASRPDGPGNPNLNFNRQQNSGNPPNFPPGPPPGMTPGSNVNNMNAMKQYPQPQLPQARQQHHQHQQQQISSVPQSRPSGIQVPNRPGQNGPVPPFNNNNHNGINTAARASPRAFNDMNNSGPNSPQLQNVSRSVPQPRTPSVSGLPPGHLQNPNATDSNSMSSIPVVGFVNGRKAQDVLEKGNAASPIPPNIPTFNPSLESPSLRRTTGVDHHVSKPVKRNDIQAALQGGSNSSSTGAGGSSNGPGGSVGQSNVNTSSGIAQTTKGGLPPGPGQVSGRPGGGPPTTTPFNPVQPRGHVPLSNMNGNINTGPSITGTNNFINPQADQHRRIGMPPINRNAYRSPLPAGGIKRAAPEAMGGPTTRPSALGVAGGGGGGGNGGNGPNAGSTNSTPDGGTGAGGGSSAPEKVKNEAGP